MIPLVNSRGASANQTISPGDSLLYWDKFSPKHVKAKTKAAYKSTSPRDNVTSTLERRERRNLPGAESERIVSDKPPYSEEQNVTRDVSASDMLCKRPRTTMTQPRMEARGLHELRARARRPGRADRL